MELDRSYGAEVGRDQRAVALKDGHTTAAVIVSAWDNASTSGQRSVHKTCQEPEGRATCSCYKSGQRQCKG